jgi:dihydroxyacid dehydratase/phosphogluconate dehydratase
MVKPRRLRKNGTSQCGMRAQGQAHVEGYAIPDFTNASGLHQRKMYTANTMASAAEALGMTLPGSSSFPAESPEKLAECDSAGAAMHNLLEKNILPRHVMTRSAFENAMVCAVCSPLCAVRCSMIIRY